MEFFRRYGLNKCVCLQNSIRLRPKHVRLQACGSKPQATLCSPVGTQYLYVELPSK